MAAKGLNVMVAISVVVTAPIGVDACRYLDALLEQAGSDPFEVLVIDGSSSIASPLPDGVRHVAAPGQGIQALIARGVREASFDWVLVTEDHCRPLPGMIDAYRRAVRDNPQADLFSGAAENLTSTSPWSFAVFLLGLGDQWPPQGFHRASTSNANMLVRRNAVHADENAKDGGLLNLTVPRLTDAGHHMHCRDAVVDHILNLSPAGAFAFQFGCSSSATAVSRAIAEERPLAMQLLRDLADLGYTPLRLLSERAPHVRGSLPYRLGMMARLAALGFTSALAICSVDLKRVFRREVREGLRTAS